MSTINFTTILLVDQSPSELYNAINNVRGWWQGEIAGSTDHLNDEFSYQMKTFHFSKQRVIELVPNKKIVWLVTESNLSFLSHKTEWTGTKIIFEISGKDHKTQLRFTHDGLYPEIECYNACSNGWSKLIQESLLSSVATGVGKEVF